MSGFWYNFFWSTPLCYCLWVHPRSGAMKSFVVFSLVCVLAVIASGESDKTFQYSEKVGSQRVFFE